MLLATLTASLLLAAQDVPPPGDPSGGSRNRPTASPPGKTVMPPERNLDPGIVLPPGKAPEPPKAPSDPSRPKRDSIRPRGDSVKPAPPAPSVPGKPGLRPLHDRRKSSSR